MSPNLDLLRILFAVALLLAGAALRFLAVSRRMGYVLGLPWTSADEEIRVRADRRLGVLCMLWGILLGVQAAIGMPVAWMTTLWAPLGIVAILSVAYPARLYLDRYGTLRVEQIRGEDERPVPARGGWGVIIAREVVPLAAVLLPILVVRATMGELPDRIPIRWGLVDGPTDWRWKDDALVRLRHQTAVVYLLLLLLEAGRLLWRWARGSRRDIAGVLLTRPHWRYFLFRTGWVAVFAGVNVGFVLHAIDGRAPGIYVLPGALVLALAGSLLVRALRRAEYAPPR